MGPGHEYICHFFDIIRRNKNEQIYQILEFLLGGSINTFMQNSNHKTEISRSQNFWCTFRYSVRCFPISIMYQFVYFTSINVRQILFRFLVFQEIDSMKNYCFTLNSYIIWLFEYIERLSDRCAEGGILGFAPLWRASLPDLPRSADSWHWDQLRSWNRFHARRIVPKTDIFCVLKISSIEMCLMPFLSFVLNKSFLHFISYRNVLDSFWPCTGNCKYK